MYGLKTRLKGASLTSALLKAWSTSLPDDHMHFQVDQYFKHKVKDKAEI